MFRKLVDCCLDNQWLSEQVGRDVRAHYVRLKPGTSIVVGFSAGDGADGCADGSGVDDYGWARLLWPGAQGKAAKAVDKARDTGALVRGSWIDDVLFQTGGVASDPKLLKALGKAGVGADAAAGGLGAGLQVLRYNPLRRAVLRDGDQVVRVSRTAQLDGDTYAAVGRAVHVPAMLSASRDGRISTVAFVGNGDLSDTDAADNGPLHAEAGRMLARLHGLEVAGPGVAAVCSVAAGVAVRGACSDGREQMAAHAGVLDAMDAGLAARVRAVAQRLPDVDGESAVLHGDASADQFLYSMTGEVWMTDFDRLCTGPAALDLGSYLAECDPSAGHALLAGYAEVRELPAESAIHAARAHSLAARLMTPLRTAHPDWRHHVSARLDELEGQL